jgi:hypothetical protein
MAFPHDSLFLDDNKVDLDTYPKKAAHNKVLAPEWNALVRGVNAIAMEAFVNGMALTNLAPGVATSGQAIIFNGVEWVPGDVTPSSSLGGCIAILDVSVVGGIADTKVYLDPPNNTILQSCQVSGVDLLVTIRASYPKITLNTEEHILPLSGISGTAYQGQVSITITESVDLIAQVITPDEAAGVIDTVAVVLISAPEILTLTFSGTYPGTQTELKEGDYFQIHGTTDVPCTKIEVTNRVDNAGQPQVYTFASTTSFYINIMIEDRGIVQGYYHGYAKAGDTRDAYGAEAGTDNTVSLNNLYPSLSWGTQTYPSGQSALKNSEVCRQAFTVSAYNNIVFTSPNGQLTPVYTYPNLYADCTRIAGTYNISTWNLNANVVRTANDAHLPLNTVIAIANVAPTVDVTCPAARLRSGGNNGTVTQGHSITITANQHLYSAPTMNAGAGGGTFQGSWTGYQTTWTRTLNVHDNDVKAGYSFTGLVATGLAGLVQNTINSGAAYTLGGFVARDLTFGSWSQTTALSSSCVDYTKLQATIFTATNQPALRNISQGNHSNIVNTYTVDTLNVNPTSVWWNDVTAAETNSQGTAKILQLEEIV